MDFKSRNPNLNPNVEEESELIDTPDGKLKKVTRYLQFGTNDKFADKLQKIKKEMDMVYGCQPVGVSYIKMETKPKPYHIDGSRICAHCDWLERDRIFDINGKFKIGSLIRSINKELLGKTKSSVKSVKETIDPELDDWLKS